MFDQGCKVALPLLLLAAAGCRMTPPPIALDTRGVKPVLKYDALAEVLTSAVEAGGRIDTDALKSAAATLDAQLKLLAVTGPTAKADDLSTDQHVLAYWYNARAAWAMKLLLAENCPAEIRPAALYDRPFPLDARSMTLRHIDAILAKDGDFRVAVAAPGVTMQHARLPSRPFTHEGIRQRVVERFTAFVDDERRFVIDVRRQRIMVPPVLWQFRRSLIQAHHTRYGVEGATLTTVLLAYLKGSAHRRLQDAIGYPVFAARSGKLRTCTEGN